jgi:hypothetical protein
MKQLFALALVVATSGSARAESILERAYSSEKLEVFWTRTLGAVPPDPARFALLAPGLLAAQPTREVPAGDFGLPFTGVVLGESANPQGPSEAHGFPVIPLSSADAAVLMRRLAWAEIYLARYRFFAPVSTDTAEVLDGFAARQYAAALESYLITARLYFSAGDLPEKCVRLTRMNEIAKGPMSGIGVATPLPPPWQPLVPIALATKDRLGTDVLARLVCSVQPVRGRAETVQMVETRVREQIITAVRAKVDETLTLMNAKATEFQTLVNDMDVLIKSAETIELERVLGNAQANMVLVKEDQLKAAETIATLQAVDLSSLNQPTSLQEFETAQVKMAGITARIDAVMTALAGLAQVSDDPTIAAELAPCASLAGAYPALDLAQDSGTLTARINGPYEDCIARARSVVAQFQEPSLEKAKMAELAKQVRQLSEGFLSSVVP